MRDAARIATPSWSSRSRWSTETAPIRHPELGGPGPRQLLGMELGSHPVGSGGGEHPLRLGHREEALVTKDVGELGVTGDGRDHVVDDLVDVLLGRGRLGRHGVGAEERADDPNADPLAGGPDDAQAAQLIGELEPVARLRFQSGSAAVERGLEPLLDQGLQQVVRCRAGGRHRAQDAARGIRLTRQPRRGLVRAVTDEDRMGVGVHQAGADQCAAEVLEPVGGRGLVRCPDPRHPPVADEDGPRREGAGGIDRVDLRHQQPPGPGQEQRLVGHGANHSRPSTAPPPPRLRPPAASAEHAPWRGQPRRPPSPRRAAGWGTATRRG